MNGLKNKLNNKQFVTTVEIDPPKGASPWIVYEKMKNLKGVVDAVNIADCPMGKMRMSPIALAHLVQKELQLEAIFHLTCRDRNVIGLQSELLGAYALGVKNILTLTGDKPENGDHPEAKGVFELDSTGLIKLANTLNQGTDMMGNNLNEATEFFIGGVANPTATDLEIEVSKVEAKIDSGVNFFQTQPIFDINSLEHFLTKINDTSAHFIYGLMPLKSVKLAQYLNKNVPGIVVPDKIIDRLQLKGREAGLEIAKELYLELKKMVPGVHIFPMGDVPLIEELLQEQGNGKG
ncbi:5,10-methylenetetrahydrofolate reductase [Desulfonispora thiosulfatigenes DSM 11270]|uniref:Methylenetetrahydrofolate reductase n=1 Tax=Desulfonispora thiosulfatigenes DSM 11270 TaxID=656914 RepID=A0A1W1V0A6_DESTI|nr:methylenetetrahydrofolate reductase [Desulfonispora thiosulfatigenes]SMB86768.1 5,10-methylenetetrahydrofolate reductase [Desulfonispora thiosulfatigenes DSM 11270]